MAEETLMKVTVYQKMTYLVMGTPSTIKEDVMDPLKRIAFVGEGDIHPDVLKGMSEASIEDLANATGTMGNVGPHAK